MDIEKLYQDYFLVVYKYILSISHDPLTAEEITQDTFFKALKKIDDFRGDSGIRVWLYQIAKNTYYDYVKRQGRLSELPEEYGEEIFSLRTFGELSFSDIAELFGKSESWARVTYHRARMMIKEGMKNG